ncbi:Gfo/Idh/MocA family protein [Stieleria varia]|uniref:1,5-anhydro-D-fructose reductase n=1 Tax=Stieleria varia TaxID=2528005 RepID=A0A5C6AEV5_9BACT|nr:Gfo/Idh/MocA family oxidoreductase [Stieleria varia]TWT98504.1 1,5-anhydro-D-fructose reductase [Stieleria varia]
MTASEIPSAEPPASTTRRDTRFGVIGTGRITRRLVADLQSTDGVAVTAIASRDQQRAQWFANQYGIANAVTGYAALLERDDIDAVYISLPPSMHHQWCVKAAEAGKHLLCEKPLAMNAEQAVEIDQVCSASSVRWLDATGWQHHPRTDQMKQWLLENRFGEIGHVTAAVSFYKPFLSDEHRLDSSLGGGCLLDLAWYTCGLIRWATDKMPVSVMGDAVMHGDVPMRVTGMLRFDDDSTASFSCGYDTATRKWFEVAGSASSLICDDFTRPWDDRPTRCWIHEASGEVASHTFGGAQERVMIAKLVGDASLKNYQTQAIDTHRILDALSKSLQSETRVELADAASVTSFVPSSRV